MSPATADDLVFWFAALLTLLLTVFLIAVFWPRVEAASLSAQGPPAEHDHLHPRHARDAAGWSAFAAPVPPLSAPQPDPAGQALPVAPGGPVGTRSPVSGRPPWEPAPAPTGEELIGSTAEELTRLLYGWHPDMRRSAHRRTAVALSDLRAAIDACLLFGNYQR